MERKSGNDLKKNGYRREGWEATWELDVKGREAAT